MSTHSVNVIQVNEVAPHPNADNLELVKVSGYTCVVRKGTFPLGSKAVYIEPDYVVPDTPEFSFLAGKRRIGVRRFRGVYSQGLLMPATDDMVVGQNVMEMMGIVRWEPPEDSSNGTGDMSVSGPTLVVPKYDLENIRKYPVIARGTPVVVTEKIHGTNARFVYADGQFYVGSRTRWLSPESPTVWWSAVAQNPCIEKFCRHFPLAVLFGEVFGNVQSLRYGAKQQELFFAAFDILDGGRFVERDRFESMCLGLGVPMTPKLYQGPFELTAVEQLAEQDSSWPTAKHCREGVVIQVIPETYHQDVGRLKLKLVSNRYLEG